jgi:hypothetical protein
MIGALSTVVENKQYRTSTETMLASPRLLDMIKIIVMLGRVLYFIGCSYEGTR